MLHLYWVEQIRYRYDCIHIARSHAVIIHNIKSPYPIDLGEIYICIDVAKENALQYKNSLNRELSFLFVHGLLHLLGYDHMKQEDEEVMFHLQDIILGDKNE